MLEFCSRLTLVLLRNICAGHVGPQQPSHSSSGVYTTLLREKCVNVGQGLKQVTHNQTAK